MNEDNKIVAGQILKAASVAANTVSDEDMKAINRFTLKELTADEVFTFKVKMADNSLDDRNFAPFTLKALKQLEKLYVGRTVGKDHRREADNQCARIYATALTESTKTNGVNGEKVYDLTAKCYMVRTEANKSLIAEIEAGIKREVSTSCSCSKVICSICGTDNTKDYCRHWCGSTYDTKDGKKTCYMLLDEIKDAYELSFVAVPAQPQAGTYKAFGNKVEYFATENKETSETGAVCAQGEAKTALHIAEEFLYLESEEFDHE